MWRKLFNLNFAITLGFGFKACKNVVAVSVASLSCQISMVSTQEIYQVLVWENNLQGWTQSWVSTPNHDYNNVLEPLWTPSFLGPAPYETPPCLWPQPLTQERILSLVGDIQIRWFGQLRLYEKWWRPQYSTCVSLKQNRNKEPTHKHFVWNGTCWQEEKLYHTSENLIWVSEEKLMAACSSGELGKSISIVWRNRYNVNIGTLRECGVQKDQTDTWLHPGWQLSHNL